MALRRELHRRGLRYRVQVPVPGNRRRRIDVAFTRARVAVMVDGCFWHGCPEHGRVPRSNSAWWRAKVEANQARDRDTDRVLVQDGYRVLRFWEHQGVAECADVVERAVRGGGFVPDFVNNDGVWSYFFDNITKNDSCVSVTLSQGSSVQGNVVAFDDTAVVLSEEASGNRPLVLVNRDSIVTVSCDNPAEWNLY